MRQFYDNILAFIVSASLNDLEFDTCKATIPIYDQSTYEDLANVLASRGGSATVYQSRLKHFYEAKGVNIDPIKTGKSNIFIGGALN